MENGAENRIVAVIVAAGRGERAGQAQGPKQYRDLGGKSVLQHAINAFEKNSKITDILVVIHADDHDLYASHVEPSAKLLPAVNGGKTRQDSVFAGLSSLSGTHAHKVLVHDAARPFLSDKVINAVLDGLEKHDAVLPALAVADTLKRADAAGKVQDTVSREHLFAAQTPQGFSYSKLMEAHQKAQDENLHDFTDDSAIAEWSGLDVTLVAGSPENTKITTVEDMEKARSAMSLTHATMPDIRVGHGYDTHQLVEGSSIWLCGVELPHTHSLSGHSDADVGLHALTDALLGAIANGDIGSHFPPSDDRWKGARSDQFLRHAMKLVKQAGGVVTHMDVTLVCEAPKIGPHRDTMRGKMAEITGVDMSRISVKATTNERIGFIGREEGMVALATATVVMQPAGGEKDND